MDSVIVTPVQAFDATGNAPFKIVLLRTMHEFYEQFVKVPADWAKEGLTILNKNADIIKNMTLATNQITLQNLSPVPGAEMNQFLQTLITRSMCNTVQARRCAIELSTDSIWNTYFGALRDRMSVAMADITRLTDAQLAEPLSQYMNRWMRHALFFRRYTINVRATLMTLTRRIAFPALKIKHVYLEWNEPLPLKKRTRLFQKDDTKLPIRRLENNTSRTYPFYPPWFGTDEKRGVCKICHKDGPERQMASSFMCLNAGELKFSSTVVALTAFVCDQPRCLTTFRFTFFTMLLKHWESLRGDGLHILPTCAVTGVRHVDMYACRKCRCTFYVNETVAQQHEQAHAALCVDLLAFDDDQANAVFGPHTCV